VKKVGVAPSARKLYDYLKLLPAGDISIKLLGNDWIRIQAAAPTPRMVGMARTATRDPHHRQFAEVTLPSPHSVP